MPKVAANKPKTPTAMVKIRRFLSSDKMGERLHRIVRSAKFVRSAGA